MKVTASPCHQELKVVFIYKNIDANLESYLSNNILSYQIL